MVKKHLNEVFTITREVNGSKGNDCFLARMEGGIILLSEETEKGDMRGSSDMKIFTFMCVASGNASLQFVSYSIGQPGRFLFEDVLSFEISGQPLVAESNNSNSQEVSEIVCLNEAGFVQEFCVKWKKVEENGETDWSQRYPISQSRTIDLDKYTIPDGAEAWVKVKAILGVTKEADDHVIYRKGAASKATYCTSGATLTFKITLQ